MLKVVECVLLTHITPLQATCYRNQEMRQRKVRIRLLGILSPLALLKLKLSQLIVYSSISTKTMDWRKTNTPTFIAATYIKTILQLAAVKFFSLLQGRT